MERIVLRHLSGSKANQVEEFPLSHFNELMIGRDPSSTVQYDPDRDNLVGRQHAKIIRDPTNPDEFLITDLGGRTGTFVNKQRVVGTARIRPGDLIQFGVGGPEFQFDVEPRPAGAMRPTRVAVDTAAPTFTPTPIPPTRVGDRSTMLVSDSIGSVPPTWIPRGAVGKATIERMIAQTKSDSRRNIIIGASMLVLVIGAVAAFLVLRPGPNRPPDDKFSPAMIADEFASSTVYIEAAWKLLNADTGELAYHYYVLNRMRTGEPLVQDGPPQLACFVMVNRKTGTKLEPALGFDSKVGRPIGGGGTGSGFVATSDGFILTSRHVAAAWSTRYYFPEDAQKGILVQQVQEGRFEPVPGQDGRPKIVDAPTDWVPDQTMQATTFKSGQVSVEGRNDLLNVTFAKNELRLPARVARISDRHDVAMIKVDASETLTKIEFNDNYDTIKPGDAAIVLGYPGISPPLYGVVLSQDRFNQLYTLRNIPNPTISVGKIGPIAHAQINTTDPVVSSFGDNYQLTLNSTGGGNSGGPVFDDHGKTIGIFTVGKSESGAAISFAVPIRYAKEMVGNITEPAKPEPDWAIELRDEVRKLRDSKIVFNAPAKMRQGTSERVEARVSYDDVGIALTQGLKGHGLPIEEPIKVGPVMKVVLYAQNDLFQITKFSNEEQTILGKPFAQWEWDVVPLESGIQSMHLKASVTLRVPHLGEKPFDLPVIDQTINVEVDRWYASKRFIATYWQWVSATLLVPLVVWAYKKLRSMRNGKGSGTRKPEEWVS